MKRIRIFGEVNPYEDERYETFFNIKNDLEILLVLHLQDMPENNNWILEYDEFIGNISKFYKNVQKEKNKIIKEKFGKDYKLLDIELDSLILKVGEEEYAKWEYVGYTDDIPGYDETYILDIFTDSLGNILSVTEEFE